MDDPDLDALEREQGPAFRPGFDDDEYEDLDVVAPTLYTIGGVPIPDLRKVPREDWDKLLRCCSPWLRRRAIDPLAGQDGHIEALRIDFELRGEERERRQKALERSSPPPAPRIESGFIRRRADRQVSFRMTVRERSDLERVAMAYGVSSARLARMLTIRGVRRALGEEP
jgi:hypothetical protein